MDEKLGLKAAHPRMTFYDLKEAADSGRGIIKNADTMLPQWRQPAELIGERMEVFGLACLKKEIQGQLAAQLEAAVQSGGLGATTMVGAAPDMGMGMDTGTGTDGEGASEGKRKRRDKNKKPSAVNQKPEVPSYPKDVSLAEKLLVAVITEGKLKEQDIHEEVALRYNLEFLKRYQAGDGNAHPTTGPFIRDLFNKQGKDSARMQASIALQNALPTTSVSGEATTRSASSSSASSSSASFSSASFSSASSSSATSASISTSASTTAAAATIAQPNPANRNEYSRPSPFKSPDKSASHGHGTRFKSPNTDMRSQVPAPELPDGLEEGEAEPIVPNPPLPMPKPVMLATAPSPLYAAPSSSSVELKPKKRRGVQNHKKEKKRRVFEEGGEWWSYWLVVLVSIPMPLSVARPLPDTDPQAQPTRRTGHQRRSVYPTSTPSTTRWRSSTHKPSTPAFRVCLIKSPCRVVARRQPEMPNGGGSRHTLRRRASPSLVTKSSWVVGAAHARATER